MGSTRSLGSLELLQEPTGRPTPTPWQVSRRTRSSQMLQGPQTAATSGKDWKMKSTTRYISEFDGFSCIHLGHHESGLLMFKSVLCQ